MTTLITRFFESEDQARMAERELIYNQNLAPSIVRVFDKADGLAATLTKANVAPETAKAYEKRMANGGAVIMVSAGYKPLGVAKITREVVTKMGAADLGDLNESVFFKDERKRRLSILSEHPFMLTRLRDRTDKTYHMADWPIPLLSKRKPYDEMAISRHGRMANWPIPLISKRKPYTGSIFPRHARMASFPIGLISKRKPFTGSIFPRHARMANWPIPLISRRKPFTKSLIPRHMHMANWPFPHLIDGKTGTNALMPGGPRMANFPIPLLSDRKPFTGSIFSRHAHMANFPIGLISKRKPFTGSAIPRHARMADIILPLVTRRSDTSAQTGGSGFSFSKMIGMPTIKRR
jgi:hypothetical protein